MKKCIEKCMKKCIDKCMEKCIDKCMKKCIEKCIKNIISFVMCIALTLGIFAGMINMPQNVIVAEAAGEFRTGENAQEVFRFLVCTMGLTPAAACGIMANIEYESGFRTDVYGDNHTSYGLCQWHDTSLNSGRMTNLFNFCARNGYDVKSVDGQMRFLLSELTGGRFNETYAVLRNATNDLNGVSEVAKRWCIYFEVPADRFTKAEQRAALAMNTYWPLYGNINGVNVRTVTARCVTETSAILSGSVYKPKDVAIEANGIYFGASAETMTPYANTKFTGSTTDSYGLSFDFYTGEGGASPSLGVTLEPRTTYYYQFYCVSGGVEYKGPVKTFTTALETKSISIAKAEYDLEFDYEQWYENVDVKKNNNWTMPPVTIDYTVTPADTTDVPVWTSSNTAIATVSDGKVYVKDEGETTITVTSGKYSASCKVYTGRVFDPKLEFKSKTQGTKQNSFVIGDTVQISPVRQSSVNCYFLQIYKTDGSSESLKASNFFSKENDDKSDWWLEESWEFVPAEPGTYKAHMLFANKSEAVYKDFYFEVLDKSDDPIDSSMAETPIVSGLGSLAGVSMSLDGYIIMNYFVLPTDDSIGTDMCMQFTVAGQTQTDSEYDIAVVGDKVAYKYQCKLAAVELTENITAKLVLGDSVKEITTISAKDYCSNVLAGAGRNEAFAAASPVVKSLMNYCGYAQIYFGKNTDNPANAGLYSGSADPVADENFSGIADDENLFGAYINGTEISSSSTDSNISMNGIRYVGASLLLDSGSGLNLYFVLPDGMSTSDITSYVVNVDGLGNICFVASSESDIAQAPEAVSEAGDEVVTEQTTEEDAEEVQEVEASVEEQETEAGADEQADVVGTTSATVTINTVIDGERIACILDGNILCVQILDIPADELDNVYSVKIAAPDGNNLMIKYSPVKYMIDMQGINSSNGVKLMRAMYLYYKEVEAYNS